MPVVCGVPNSTSLPSQYQDDRGSRPTCVNPSARAWRSACFSVNVGCAAEPLPKHPAARATTAGAASHGRGRTAQPSAAFLVSLLPDSDGLESDDFESDDLPSLEDEDSDRSAAADFLPRP